jgi:hypothetical protein
MNTKHKTKGKENMNQMLSDIANFMEEAIETLADAYKLLEEVQATLAEPEMPVDRGAWLDVPDATKWVDELRGDETEEPLTLEEEQEEQQQLETHLDTVYQRNNQAFLEQAQLGQTGIKRLQKLAVPPNFSMDVVESEPIGEIVQAFDDLTAVSIPNMPPVGTKLYAAPPKREWIGLTDEEIVDAYAGGMLVFAKDSNKALARAIEAKLKEKNT